MKDIVYKNEKGEKINISLLGFFKIDQLGKEYVMYSMVNDDDNKDTGYVLLGEVVRNDNEIQILGILDSEKELVTAYYNEISNQIGGSKNE